MLYVYDMHCSALGIPISQLVGSSWQTIMSFECKLPLESKSWRIEKTLLFLRAPILRDAAYYWQCQGNMLVFDSFLLLFFCNLTFSPFTFLTFWHFCCYLLSTVCCWVCFGSLGLQQPQPTWQSLLKRHKQVSIARPQQSLEAGYPLEN